MATVDDAIREAYKGRAERIQAILNTAASLARATGTPEVSLLFALITQLAAEVA